MNILNNKNKRKSIFKALALCLFAAVSFTLVSCDDDMDIQQSYPFTVGTMPVPNKVTKGQTVEASRNSGAETRYRFSVAHSVSANRRFTVPMARWVSYRFSAG